MIIARNEKNMLHISIFWNFSSHDFYREARISDYTINSSELIIDSFNATLSYSFDLNESTHRFSNFDHCFQMKIFFAENMTAEIDDTFFSNISRLVSKKAQMIAAFQHLIYFDFDSIIDLIQQFFDYKLAIRWFIAESQCLMMSYNVRILEMIE